MPFKPKYQEKTELIAVRVPTDIHQAIKRRAEKEGRSKSEVVVRTLESALPAEPETGDTIFD